MRPEGFPPLDRIMVGLLAAILVLLIGGVLVHVGTPLLDRWLGSTNASVPPATASGATTAEGAAEPEPPLPTGVPNDGVRSPVERRARTGLPLPTAPGALQGGTFTLRTKNSIGRSGVVFIPPEATRGARPLLILFHGTGGSGAQMLAAFMPLARLHGLIVLGLDSGRSPDGAYNWQVPDSANDVTVDVLHTRASLDELYATPGLHVDPERVLAAGHSGGGSTAAYHGTTDPRIRAFAVLHGGVFIGGLGSSQARAWFSTGSEDTLRPPAVVERAAAATQHHAGSVTTRIYPGGHGLSTAELDDVIAWWLGL